MAAQVKAEPHLEALTGMRGTLFELDSLISEPGTVQPLTRASAGTKRSITLTL